MRKFIYIKEDGSGASNPVILAKLLDVAEERIVKGGGRFTLTVDGIQAGPDENRADILVKLRRRLTIGVVGPAYRVRDPEKVVLACREVSMAPDIIDTSGNDKADLYWTLLKAEFPHVTFLGAYVCKPDSQHRFGNAVDGGFGDPKTGELMWQWAIDNRKQLHLRNCIVQKKIWHLGVVSAYTGTPHVTHTHADFDETYDTSLPCGVLPKGQG